MNDPAYVLGRERERERIQPTFERERERALIKAMKSKTVVALNNNPA